jgi:hypothetical protein
VVGWDIFKVDDGFNLKINLRLRFICKKNVCRFVFRMNYKLLQFLLYYPKKYMNLV